MKNLILFLFALAGLIIGLTINVLHLWPCLDFSKTGQFGDTIGGLTGPIVNTVAVFLVYHTYKEQRSANRIIERQDAAHRIIEQLNSIQIQSDVFNNAVAYVVDQKSVLMSTTALGTSMIMNLNLNQIRLFLKELELAYSMIDQYNGDKTPLKTKLDSMYAFVYRNALQDFFLWFDESVPLESRTPHYKDRVQEIKDLYADLNKKSSN